MEQAVEVAVSNCLRGKGKRAQKLWKKKAVRRAFAPDLRDEIESIKKVEEKADKSWIDLVYRNAGRTPPARK